MISSRISTNMLTASIATDIVQKQHELTTVQQQITTGKRINSPSDDPAQAARILGLNEATDQLDQYNRNASSIQAQLELEENALVGVANTLNRVRELALSSNSGIVDDYTRTAAREEIRLRLDELYSLANGRDSFGNYLFSGSNTKNAPFGKSTPVTYYGRDDTQELSIGLRRTIQTGDSGMDVFMRIRNGNGDFAVYADPANTGSGIISSGAVIDPAVYDSTAYRIEFTSPTSFDILDDDTGTMIQGGNAYTSNAPIEIGGIRTNITGNPMAGDVFTLPPSTHQDIFTTISRFMDALDRSPGNSAESTRMRQDFDEALHSLDNSLEHINKQRAKVGSRLNGLESAVDENLNIKLQLERTRADIEDIDIAEAVTRLQTQASSLEILQKSYSRIEGLSLFNYL